MENEAETQSYQEIRDEMLWAAMLIAEAVSQGRDVAPHTIEIFRERVVKYDAKRKETGGL